VAGTGGTAEDGFFAVWQPKATKSIKKAGKVGEENCLIFIIFYNLRSH